MPEKHFALIACTPTTNRFIAAYETQEEAESNVDSSGTEAVETATFLVIECARVIEPGDERQRQD